MSSGILYPEQAMNKECVTVQSGMAVDWRRDDEQFLLHWFFEPNGLLRCVLLSDNHEPAQRKLVYPHVNVPGLAPSRMFWLDQCYYRDPSDVKINGAAFISFEVIDCAMVLDYKNPATQRKASGDPNFFPLSAMQFLQGMKSVQGNNLYGDSFKYSENERNDIHDDARWMADCAATGKKVSFAFFNYGLRHPNVAYATCDRILKTDDKFMIEAIRSRSKQYNGRLDLTLPPASDIIDFILEDHFWQCIKENRLDITAEECGKILLAACEDVDGLLTASSMIAAEGGKTSEDAGGLMTKASDMDSNALQDVMDWVKNNRNADVEGVRTKWSDLGKAPPQRKRKTNNPPTAILEQQGEVELSELDKHVQLLEDFVEKRNNFRQVLTNLNDLSQTGLLTASEEGVRIDIKGAHMCFHGENAKQKVVWQGNIFLCLAKKTILRMFHMFLCISPFGF